MKIRRIAASLATSALLAQSFAPVVAAETTGTVAGNGSNSENTIYINKTSNTVVAQENVAQVENYISGKASTGKNDANDNTGGDVAIKTGDAKSSVTVANDLNVNVADIEVCDCEGDVKFTIEGNGSYSDNKIDLDRENNVEVYQTNDARVKNKVDADAQTGKNDANRNTGGDVIVLTGDAKTDVDVSTTANRNVAKVGSRQGHGGHGSDNDVVGRISGNGSYSDNKIYLDLDNDIVLAQANVADIYNRIYADAETGYNDANDNTGGDVAISTGDAKTTVDVDNMVNFNAADLDCGCVLGEKFVLEGNGYDSYNKIKADFEDNQELFQANDDYTKNKVDADAETGKNDVKRNTADVEGSDPVIITGDAHQDVDVENSGNVNVIGDAGHHDFPEVEFDFDFHHFWTVWSHMFSNH